MGREYEHRIRTEIQLENCAGTRRKRWQTISGALVEVFVSDGRIPTQGDEQPHQKRVAGCKTAEDGEFCFKGLPSGRYEVRSSVDNGWDVTHVVVTVDAKNGNSERLDLPMQLGN